MVEISKADWKLFRERISDCTSPGNASDYFWELEKRIKQDKKHLGVSLEMNKGEAIWNIAILV